MDFDFRISGALYKNDINAITFLSLKHFTDIQINKISKTNIKSLNQKIYLKKVKELVRTLDSNVYFLMSHIIKHKKRRIGKQR